MIREEMIKTIENLYPADSPWDRTVGEKFLMKAICNWWRHLPEETLIRYLNLCIIEEQKI